MSEFKSYDELEEERRQDIINRQNNRDNRMINRKIKVTLDRKKRWVIGGTISGSLLVATSLAAGLFSASIKPSSVGYLFGHEAESAEYTQSDPDDYRTKDYRVNVFDKTGNEKTYDVPFTFLEKEIPSGENVSRMVNLGTDNNPVMVQVTRQEEYPTVKNLISFGSIFTLFGAGVVATQTVKKTKEFDAEIDELSGHLHK